LLLIKDLVAGSKVGGCRELAKLGIYLSADVLLPLATSGLSNLELTWKYLRTVGATAIKRDFASAGSEYVVRFIACLRVSIRVTLRS
jgi:hypothetical protein